MAILKLCNREAADSITSNLLQHSDDLDFVQEVLDTTASHSGLNPTVQAVLAGFSRRKNLGRFKVGQQSVALDRLRFSHLVSAGDNDTESRGRTSASGGMSQATCRFFQRETGCRFPNNCRFDHLCSICGNRRHGAIDCDRRRAAGSRTGRRPTAYDQNQRASSTPPDPRRRQSRAANA